MRRLLRFIHVIPHSSIPVIASSSIPVIPHNSIPVIPNPRKARVRNLLFAAAILIVAALAHAQAKHPFTFDDMMKLKRVGDPQVSPDGKWVLFSVVDVDLAANTKTPHIWIVPLMGTDGKGKVGEENSSDQKGGMPHVSPNLRDVGSAEHATNRQIKTPTAHAGHQTASASRSSQRKKTARRCGLPISTARREP